MGGFKKKLFKSSQLNTQKWPQYIFQAYQTVKLYNVQQLQKFQYKKKIICLMIFNGVKLPYFFFNRLQSLLKSTSLEYTLPFYLQTVFILTVSISLIPYTIIGLNQLLKSLTVDQIQQQRIDFWFGILIFIIPIFLMGMVIIKRLYIHQNKLKIFQKVNPQQSKGKSKKKSRSKLFQIYFNYKTQFKQFRNKLQLYPFHIKIAALQLYRLNPLEYIKWSKEKRLMYLTIFKDFEIPFQIKNQLEILQIISDTQFQFFSLYENVIFIRFMLQPFTIQFCSIKSDISCQRKRCQQSEKNRFYIQYSADNITFNCSFNFISNKKMQTLKENLIQIS